MRLNHLNPPCKGCDHRTVEPNCHNPDICDQWAAYQEEYQKYQRIRDEQRAKDSLAESYILDQYTKIMKERGWKHRK